MKDTTTLIIHGSLYMVTALLLVFAPNFAMQLFLCPPVVGAQALQWTTVTGVTLGIIAYFYIACGWLNSHEFALASLIDRAAVPVLLLPLAYAGKIELNLALAFSILDPLLALHTYSCMKSAKTSRE
eukprot:gnl/Spiro4/9484_TR5020_c0_g1_i2.p1 gnl/Spiro4/9484_TR5020_c0_g1~~gnl/Spiro4/9484_TR5020_c0_g1_i2.p1  ORF type:complete len:143 (-),score=24.29 gnl/Spiro4/9484_TR5020_c0_g1_i2:110-490(-)